MVSWIPTDRWSLLREELKEFRKMASTLVKLYLPAVSSFARMVLWVAVSSIISKGVSDFFNYLENKIPIGGVSTESAAFDRNYYRYLDTQQLSQLDTNDDWAQFREGGSSMEDVGIGPI
eukprot:jgi/Bigna1/146503/aug1.115_g21211